LVGGLFNNIIKAIDDITVNAVNVCHSLNALNRRTRRECGESLSQLPQSSMDVHDDSLMFQTCGLTFVDLFRVNIVSDNFILARRSMPQGLDKGKEKGFSAHHKSDVDDRCCKTSWCSQSAFFQTDVS
jgi:hypothetical protein